VDTGPVDPDTPAGDGRFTGEDLRAAWPLPASASAPLVATLVDVTGHVLYFPVASRLLAGTLL